MKMTKMASDYEKQKMEALSLNNDFLKKVDKLRSKWKIPKNENGFENIDACKNWELALLENNKNILFNKDFDKLILSLGESAYYNKWIYEYLLYGTTAGTPQAQNGHLIVSRSPDSKNKGKIRIFIEILSETTLNDVKNNWSFIKLLQKDTFGHVTRRKKPKTQWNRDKKIYELHRKGYSHKEIQKKMESNYKKIYVEDFSKIIDRFNKKIGDK